MKWVAFDLTRTAAAFSLILLMVTGTDALAPIAVALGTFVATGLVVSLALRPSDQP